MVSFGAARREGARPPETHPSFSEHDALLAAIAARDPEAAETAMRRHLLSVATRSTPDSAAARGAGTGPIPPARPSGERRFCRAPINASFRLLPVSETRQSCRDFSGLRAGAPRSNETGHDMTFPTRRRVLAGLAAATAGALAAPALVRAQGISEIRIDYATYNPVSLLLKQKGLLEEEFAADGTTITWAKSAGSNKALEFLSGSALDFGSTAGSAALVARINGNPIKSVYSFSKPEWTALVTRPDSGIATVADLKGKPSPSPAAPTRTSS